MEMKMEEYRRQQREELVEEIEIRERLFAPVLESVGGFDEADTDYDLNVQPRVSGVDQDTNMRACVQRFIEMVKNPALDKIDNRAPFLVDSILQHPDWIFCPPTDKENWFLVPYVTGRRVLVIATNGWTRAYLRTGRLWHSIVTHLPGSHKKNFVTVLDCIAYDTHPCKEYCILDIIKYGNLDFMHTPAIDRFKFIDQFLRDDQHLSNQNSFYTNRSITTIKSSNQVIFKNLPRFNLDNMANEWKNYTGALLKVKGFMMYHKQSSYVCGFTRLVNWLEPFMLIHQFVIRIASTNFLKVDLSFTKDYIKSDYRHDIYIEQQEKKYNKKIEYILQSQQQAQRLSVDPTERSRLRSELARSVHLQAPRQPSGIPPNIPTHHRLYAEAIDAIDRRRINYVDNLE